MGMGMGLCCRDSGPTCLASAPDVLYMTISGDTSDLYFRASSPPSSWTMRRYTVSSPPEYYEYCSGSPLPHKIYELYASDECVYYTQPFPPYYYYRRFMIYCPGNTDVSVCYDGTYICSNPTSLPVLSYGAGIYTDHDTTCENPPGLVAAGFPSFVTEVTSSPYLATATFDCGKTWTATIEE